MGPCRSTTACYTEGNAQIPLRPIPLRRQQVTVGLVRHRGRLTAVERLQIPPVQAKVMLVVLVRHHRVLLRHAGLEPGFGRLVKENDPVLSGFLHEV